MALLLGSTYPGEKVEEDPVWRFLGTKKKKNKKEIRVSKLNIFARCPIIPTGVGSSSNTTISTCPQRRYFHENGTVLLTPHCGDFNVVTALYLHPRERVGGNTRLNGYKPAKIERVHWGDWSISNLIPSKQKNQLKKLSSPFSQKRTRHETMEVHYANQLSTGGAPAVWLYRLVS